MVRRGSQIQKGEMIQSVDSKKSAVQSEECQNVSAQFPNRNTRLRKDVRPPWTAEVAENLKSRGEKLIQNANLKQKSAASERRVSKCSANLPNRNTRMRKDVKNAKPP